eukprot:4769186-Pleurochrysis_carterae.AAC.7
MVVGQSYVHQVPWQSDTRVRLGRTLLAPTSSAADDRRWRRGAGHERAGATTTGGASSVKTASRQLTTIESAN